MRRAFSITAAIGLALSALVAGASSATASVVDARYTIVSFNQTNLSWLTDSVTTKYDVYVNGTLARSVEGAVRIETTLGRLLGPADTVEIAPAGDAAAKVKATYWSNDWVYFPNLVVHFSAKSTALNADAVRKIATFAGIIERHGFPKMRAIGHDAGVPGAAGSYVLGQARSAAVLKQLKATATATTIVSSWGNCYPVASNATAAGQAANRRVELTLM